MSKEIERRFLPLATGTVGVEERDGKSGIVGKAAVVNTLSEEIFGFREQIAIGAFDAALTRSDIRGLFNHDPNYVLGRSKSGTMKVWADDDGLHYEIPDLPASRADVAEAITRGDVDGNSFSFTVADDVWETRDGVAIRTITEFEELFDVGPVTYPAYKATSVSMRSKERAQELTEAPKEEAPPEPSANLRELRAEEERILLAEAE